MNLHTIRELNTLVDFPPFSTRETTFANSCCFPVYQSPSEKGSTLKENFFPFKVYQFSERDKINFDCVASPENISA